MMPSTREVYYNPQTSDDVIDVGAVSLPGTILASDLWMVSNSSCFMPTELTKFAGDGMLVHIPEYDLSVWTSSGVHERFHAEKWLPLSPDKWPSALATLTNVAYAWEHLDPTMSAVFGS
jgi:hypothetical protein